jgi:hypothetical protein
MDSKIADKLSKEYDYFWRDNLRELPDGWTEPLVSLFDQLYKLSAIDATGDSALIAVDLYVDIKANRAFAFATPILPSRWWTDGRRKALVDALIDFQSTTMKTCTVCGNPGVAVDGQVRCLDHSDADPAKARAAALYQEVRDLFPSVHGKAINLNVPDHLWDLLASTLRSIRKLIVAENIVGKVLITRLEIDNGALFVRVRYNDLEAVFMGVQMAINEMISDLEVLSDEATRKHHHGGSDASD